MPEIIAIIMLSIFYPLTIIEAVAIGSGNYIPRNLIIVFLWLVLSVVICAASLVVLI